MANVPANLGSYKAALAGEYAIPVGRGYRARLTMPANFAPNAWNFAAWAVASFARADSKAHVLFDVRRDSDNYFRVTKLADNTLELRTRAGGTENAVVVTPYAWATGAITFLAVRLSGTNVVLTYETAAGTTTTSSLAAIGTFAGAATDYKLYCGSNWAHYDNWEGYLNLICATGGPDTPNTDRYASGSGQALATWLVTWYANLVVHVGGTPTGSTAQVDTFQGAAQGVTNTGFEVDATGWLSLGTATLSRSTAQAKAGSASLLVHPTLNSGLAVSSSTVSMVSGRWLIAKASVFPTVSSARMVPNGSPIAVKTASSIGAWNDLIAVARATATSSVPVMQFDTGGGDQDDFYLDEVYAYQLAVVSFDVLALNGVPSRDALMIGYPNYADTNAVYTPTFSWGSWNGSFPLTNLQNRETSKRARSADALITSTRFVMDAKRDVPVQGWALGPHNLSLNALIRLTVSANADGISSPLYDTDWVEAYSLIYPLNTLPAWHPAYTTRKLTLEDWSDPTYINRYPFYHVAPTYFTARYLGVQIDDTANSDGYVELGRFFPCSFYQPSYGFVEGSSHEPIDYSSRDRGPGGTPFYDKQGRGDRFSYLFKNLGEDESLTFMIDEVQRKQGISGQLLVVQNPLDYEHLHRRSGICTIEKANKLLYPHALLTDTALDFVREP